MLLPPSAGTGEASQLRGGKHRSRRIFSSSHGKAHQVYYLKRTWEQKFVCFLIGRDKDFINQLFSGLLCLCCSLWSVSDIRFPLTHCRCFLPSFLPPICPPSRWLICSSLRTVCSHLVYPQCTDAVSVSSPATQYTQCGFCLSRPGLSPSPSHTHHSHSRWYILQTHQLISFIQTHTYGLSGVNEGGLYEKKLDISLWVLST